VLKLLFISLFLFLKNIFFLFAVVKEDGRKFEYVKF